MVICCEAGAARGREGTRGHGDKGRKRYRAKVQIGAKLLCKGAKVGDKFRVAGR